MSVTDRELLADLQRLMIEPTIDDGLTWASTLWTLDEVLGYANQRQQRFLIETGIVGGWMDQAVVLQETQTLSEELTGLSHAIYRRTSDNFCRVLLPLSRQSADLALPSWLGQIDLPQGYLYEQTATRSLSLVPPPSAAGTLHLFGTMLAEVLTRAGILLTVPDEWVPYLRYGILADMLGKPGEAYDETRAQYCEQRWQEGIASARAVLEAMI